MVTLQYRIRLFHFSSSTCPICILKNYLLLMKHSKICWARIEKRNKTTLELLILFFDDPRLISGCNEGHTNQKIRQKQTDTTSWRTLETLKSLVVWKSDELSYNKVRNSLYLESRNFLSGEDRHNYFGRDKWLTMFDQPQLLVVPQIADIISVCNAQKWLVIKTLHYITYIPTSKSSLSF